jgi:hypothetical protein
MTPTSAFMLPVHETVAVCDPDGGLTTWKMRVRAVAVVPESVPGIKAPATPPRLAVMLVAVLALMANMIMAARLGKVPTANAGVVILVTPNSRPELTLLSNPTPEGNTVSETVMLWDKAPLTPVIVNVKVPTAVLAVVVTLSVDVAVAGFGLNVPVAPVGSPLTLSVTWPVKPRIGVLVRP